MPLFMHDRSTNSTADQSMHFWGICCESGKQYEQVVGQRFRITMAVLDPKSSSKSGDKTVSLFVIRGGVEYLLCVLKHDEIHQVNLNLIFDKGENVIFYINGYGKVYLSGYQLTDSENDVLNDEHGYLCPLVEVTTNSKLGRKSKGKMPRNSTPQPIVSKSKKKSDVDITDLDIADKRKKEARNRYANEDNKFEDLEFDEETESDDDDYQVEEESESDDEEESSESVDEDDDEEEDNNDDDDIDDDDDDDDEEEEMEEIVFTKSSQKKRKLENISQPKKRSRVGSPNAVEKLKTVSYVEDEKDDSKDSSDSGALNSSIGNTPMPKKQTVMEKKSKKKKKLSEISILSEKSVKGQKSPTTTESTPNKMDNSIKKLDGGLEIQDLIIGKGPEAKVGKMVYVFYVGRLPNKQIFDSRVPGVLGKKPFSFKLGAQQVIKGFDIGIQGMCVGGKRKLKIPPSMGYGNAGVEGIPSNSILYFVVELVAVS